MSDTSQGEKIEKSLAETLPAPKIVEDEKFLKMAKLNDAESLLGLIEKGVKFNFVDESGNCVLKQLIIDGRFFIVEAICNRLELINSEVAGRVLPFVIQDTYDQFYATLLQLISSAEKLNYRDNTGRTALFKAVEQGDISKVEELAGKGADINLTSNRGNSPLHVASKLGHRNIVEYLLTLDGIKIDQQNIEGKTALYLSIEFDFDDITQILLNKGANPVLAELKNNVTPLMVCVLEYKTTVIDAVISASKGSNALDTENTAHRSAIAEAAISGSLDLYKKLKAAGASCEPNQDGWSPFTFAIYNEHFELVEYILRNEENPLNLLEPKNIKHKRPLAVVQQRATKLNKKANDFYLSSYLRGQIRDAKCTQNFQKEVDVQYDDDGFCDVSELLTQGSEYNQAQKLSSEDNSGELKVENSALVQACQTLDLRSVKFQLTLPYSKQMAIEALSYVMVRGESWCCVKQDLINVLIKPNSNDSEQKIKQADLKTKEGEPLLALCARNGWDKWCKELIKIDKCFEVRDLDGETALNLAITHGRLTLAQWFIDNGASLAFTSKNGCTPLHCALKKKLQGDCESRTERDKELLAVRIITMDKVNNVTNVDGNTPLHEAVRNKRSKAFDKLVSFNVDLSVANVKNYTPLYLAAGFGRLRMFRELEKKGATHSAESCDGGSTALINAIRYRHGIIVQYICDNARKNNELEVIVPSASGRIKPLEFVTRVESPNYKTEHNYELEVILTQTMNQISVREVSQQENTPSYELPRNELVEMTQGNELSINLPQTEEIVESSL